MKVFHLTKTDYLDTLTLDNESGLSIPLSHNDFQYLAEKIAVGENVRFGLVEVVYVDENEIIRLNTEHLGRDYITDVITFSYDDEAGDFANSVDTKVTDGTIFMCAQRILEQSEELNTDSALEFKRIFVHGLLHLCGFEDTTPELKADMTLKENTYLG